MSKIQSAFLEDEEDEEDEWEIWVLVRQESPTYDNIQSAVKQLYTATDADMPLKMQNSISLYIKGSKRLNKLAKHILGLDLSEGQNVWQKMYSKLCYILFRSDQVEHIFAHLFFCFGLVSICSNFICVLYNIFYIELIFIL